MTKIALLKEVFQVNTIILFFKVSESLLRTKRIVEQYVKCVSKLYTFHFNENVKEPVICEKKSFLKSQKNMIKVSVSDETLKAKLEASRVLWFGIKSFNNISLPFSPYSDYKLNNTYTSNIIINILTFDKVILKCHFLECSIVNGVRQISFAYICFG